MKKVLVIEDDFYIRTNIIELLEIEEFEVIEAENGKIGFEKALQHRPDLILCDVMMPEMDGYEVLKNVRSDASIATIPFVFLTAKANKIDLRQGMERGADDYLIKPFTRTELLNSIVIQLQKKAMVDEYAEKQLDELRQNISYALPHELLTPLNGIIGSSDMLKNNLGDFEKEDIIELAEMIHSSAIRMHRLVQNFLLYSRLEVIASNPQAVELLKGETTYSVSTSISEVIERICGHKGRGEDMQVEACDHGVNISEVYFDKILEEIIDNALKFSEPGTPISVSAVKQEDRIHIEITDRGRGLTGEQIAHLGAYRQFDRKQHEQQGSGLGLIIVKRLIELHNGEWNVQSSPGEFTKISLKIPMSKQEVF
ncbi:MAG TPA: response regulator [Patescibacteria group bacterium]|nr:response regulator [Patescibacteria group bacterium]